MYSVIICQKTNKKSTKILSMVLYTIAIKTFLSIKVIRKKFLSSGTSTISHQSVGLFTFCKQSSRKTLFRVHCKCSRLCKN